ncbi:MAG: uroporphyrinogen-III synthase, partial [Notoacmeibacter sp.]|nr:uroporphyrinogen-III synthase [Notoacmeibacter sp.]
SALAGLGHDPVVMPLTQIMPHVPDLSEPWPDFTQVVVTSANALRHAPESLIRHLSGLPLLAVGEATAAAARKAGFTDVTAGEGAAAALLPLLPEVSSGPCHIAYLAGTVRRPDLERAMVQRQLPHTVIETYETKKVSYTTHEMNRIFAKGVPDVALMHSAESAAAAGALPADHIRKQLIEKTIFIVISARVEAALRPVGAPHVRVSAEPTEAAMLAELAAIRS